MRVDGIWYRSVWVDPGDPRLGTTGRCTSSGPDQAALGGGHPAPDRGRSGRACNTLHAGARRATDRCRSGLRDGAGGYAAIGSTRQCQSATRRCWRRRGLPRSTCVELGDRTNRWTRLRNTPAADRARVAYAEAALITDEDVAAATGDRAARRGADRGRRRGHRVGRRVNADALQRLLVGDGGLGHRAGTDSHCAA